MNRSFSFSTAIGIMMILAIVFSPFSTQPAAAAPEHYTLPDYVTVTATVTAGGISFTVTGVEGAFLSAEAKWWDFSGGVFNARKSASLAVTSAELGSTTLAVPAGVTAKNITTLFVQVGLATYRTDQRADADSFTFTLAKCAFGILCKH